ncbi:MAG: NADH-quinone oxidoreductase subunit H, partial [SAR324 cluster bacterium]|nr:NADH-quinone oxidoreductase subunit H [SAR324 cluster bacterium]
MSNNLVLLIKIVFVLNIALGMASLVTWIERKASALLQDRIGANRAGAFYKPENLLLKIIAPFIRVLGVLGFINTLFCDSVKAIFKEDFVPEGTSNFMHSLAPFISLCPVLLAFSVVPLAPDFEILGIHIQARIADIDGGIIFLLGMGSVAIFGVILAGWTGNNKFSLLGSLRASAQMISYELALGLSLLSAILLYGTTDLYVMVENQEHIWGVFLQPVAFITFCVAGMAETKRVPFDLPESESELVAGYFTEYSGMKFLLFWLAEFTEIVLFALVLSIVFLGGWNLPFWKPHELSWWGALLGHVVLMSKVV